MQKKLNDTLFNVLRAEFLGLPKTKGLRCSFDSPVRITKKERR